MNDLLNDPEFLEWERQLLGKRVSVAARSDDRHVYGTEIVRYKHLRGPSSRELGGSVHYAGELFSLKPIETTVGTNPASYKAMTVYLSNTSEDELRDAIW